MATARKYNTQKIKQSKHTRSKHTRSKHTRSKHTRSKHTRSKHTRSKHTRSKHTRSKHTRSKHTRKIKQRKYKGGVNPPHMTSGQRHNSQTRKNKEKAEKEALERRRRMFVLSVLASTIAGNSDIEDLNDVIASVNPHEFNYRINRVKPVNPIKSQTSTSSKHDSRRHGQSKT
jgi:hypothetical protein